MYLSYVFLLKVAFVENVYLMSWLLKVQRN